MDENRKEEFSPEDTELPKHFSDSIKKEKERGRMIKAIEKQLNSDPKYREYFKEYSDSSWDGFVSHYAFTKAIAFQYKEMYIKMHEEEQLKFYTAAEEAIWEIQQKKLFNYQCLWRAEKVVTEHVETEMDFYYWSQNIKNCPFIEPISNNEFDLYKDYLETKEVDDFDDTLEYIDWQDYHSFKEEAKGEEETISYPDWYAYYDMRMGTGTLMLLPDIRGEKEAFYMKIYHNNLKAKIKKQPAKQVDSREYLNAYDYELMRGFIEKFEDSKTLKSMDAYNSEAVFEDGIEFEMFIQKLCNIKEVMPIEAHYDWRIAITRAYNNYIKGKVLEQLDTVYGEYKSRISMGIGFPEVKKNPDHNTRKNILLEARVLNGEPRDLNF